MLSVSQTVYGVRKYNNLMNKELERMWPILIKVLHLPAGSDKNQNKPQSGQWVSKLRFKPVILQIQVWSISV
jgi:hypothetical protein